LHAAILKRWEGGREEGPLRHPTGRLAGRRAWPGVRACPAPNNALSLLLSPFPRSQSGDNCRSPVKEAC